MDQVVNRSLEKLRGCRVLVTGDTGFKGSWLCLWLHQLGAQVLGYALPPEQEDAHFNLLNMEELIEHVTGDIRDLASVQAVFDRFQPEVVFHLAAQPLVRYSYVEPKLTFDTNVAGSVNIFEAVRSCDSVRAFVCVTSDKCYRNNEWIWGYRENDELGGHDPYSASKAAAELVFSSYQDSFFFARSDFGAATVRAGNVIGGGDWAADRIVPDAVRALKVGDPIYLRNPNSTRPWQHVLEPLSGYLLAAVNLLERPEVFRGAWNFGPDTQSIRTVGDLAQLIVTAWGSGRVEFAPQTSAPHEARLLHLNCDKAHQLMKWHPKWGVERAIAETVDWYRDVHKGGNAFDISSRQILAYMESK
ncbi:CDP-glucose 4,6-dehydratase [Candidatus Ferrigenium straubiae]|uniref:CDP-glucose 4,6-dehydratase n=1 Tax=Candidatus Ferrigenium straubiae TaxID=2919506 RepID=UPI003F4A8D30